MTGPRPHQSDEHWRPLSGEGTDAGFFGNSVHGGQDQASGTGGPAGSPFGGTDGPAPGYRSAYVRSGNDVPGSTSGVGMGGPQSDPRQQSDSRQQSNSRQQMNSAGWGRGPGYASAPVQPTRQQNPWSAPTPTVADRQWAARSAEPATVPTVRSRRGVVLATVITALVVGAGAGAGGAWWGARSVTGQGSAQPVISTSSPNDETGSAEQGERAENPPANGNIAEIADRVVPSTVTIGLSGGGTGSGFVIDDSGLIMTNNHVISTGGSISVEYADGTRSPAEVVGGSPAYDIAVIRVDPPEGLTALPIGDPEQLRVGDQTVAVGAPLGLGGTVTSGIVSSLNRPVAVGGQSDGGSESSQAYLDAIQTDAAINPGNSGGPLVNASGQVVGVNSAILSLGGGAEGQGGNIGVGFAIGIDQAMAVGEELVATGRSSYPVIGASVTTAQDGSGVLLQEVTPGGPAAAAGLSAGDVVTAVNGQPVTEQVELIVKIRAERPGDEITLNIQGRGEVRVVLGGVQE